MKTYKPRPWSLNKSELIFECYHLADRMTKDEKRASALAKSDLMRVAILGVDALQTEPDGIRSN